MTLTSPPPTAITSTAEVRAERQDASDLTLRQPSMKRPFDIALALAMLLGSAPVWAAIALAIKLEDGGPVFYRQERWGRGRTRFQVLKFRSMRMDAEKESGAVWARKDDPRRTWFGAFLASEPVFLNRKILCHSPRHRGRALRQFIPKFFANLLRIRQNHAKNFPAAD